MDDARISAFSANMERQLELVLVSIDENSHILNLGIADHK